MFKENKSNLRGEILDAARELLLTDGITNISMRKIAGEIGCKAPSIYYHFKNKDAILHALIDEGHQILYKKLEACYDENEDPMINLEHNIQTFIRFGLENRQYYEIMYMIPLDEYERYPKEYYRRCRKTLDFGTQIFTSLHEKGLIEKQDFWILSNAMCVTLHGYLSFALTSRTDVRAERNGLLDTVIDGLFNRLGLQRPVIAAAV